MGNLKYEIRLFTIRFSKNLAQLRRKEQSVLEIKLEIMKSNLNSNKMLEKYHKCKNKKNLWQYRGRCYPYSGWGEVAKSFTSFSPATSTNVGVSPKNFLTFSLTLLSN